MALFPEREDRENDDDFRPEDGGIDYFAIAVGGDGEERCPHGILKDPSTSIANCDSCLHDQIGRLLASGEQ